MTKKEILVSIIILLVLIGGSFGGYVVWNHYDTWKKHQASVATAQTTNQSVNSDESTGLLNVDGNNGQINLGQISNGQSKADNNSSNSALDPATFSEYEKYKDNDTALFGDMQIGTGTEVQSGTKVSIAYKGWLTNGTLFDQSSTDSAGNVQPLVFTVGSHQIIAGFEQNIIGMKVGGTRLFIIPPKAGYGDTAQGIIPANSVLIFQVKLLAAL